MSAYVFPGYTTFLKAAVGRIGCPEAEVPARRIATLSEMANLCAQAGTAHPEDAKRILMKAAEFRDQLHAAYEAAELMLSDVHSALGFEEQAAEVVIDPTRKKKLPGGRVVSSKDFPAS